MNPTAAEVLDRFIGLVEDIVIMDEFRDMLTSFKDKYCHQFDDGEENKLCYMDIFLEYREMIESFIGNAMVQMDKKMWAQMHTLEELLSKSSNRSESLLDQGEIVELILSLTDFLVFKELMLDHKLSKTANYDDLNLIQVVGMKTQ